MKDYTDDDWREALSGRMSQKMLSQGSPKEIVNHLLQAISDESWKWREEIEKYLPQIRVMSFCGPVSTIKWLMKNVDIKPEHKEMADRLNEIKCSNLPDDDKTKQSLLTIFPNLGKCK